ncbi:MAG: UDP-N-acetylenolpyruvoylglucosamine reductase [Parcubacteria group bacterium Greene0714_21]|nr:MAG: UDP-N-acetylenolpyruvoylglucosamine reductase [Parcubacteria group bacterium Greene0416_39]TSC97824.1 MAG: UDP-N-acetylenolpyruvoylglucosamine reductase [Parcubacteria group bacterium Greene1014_47]TSD04582.1 MAG: UDP-N-acetylenolpyruvoylglucosamine reductase [Parcubacteria group bacterium Greene0714_21]
MIGKLEKLLPGVCKDVPLAPHTTFQIGGKARYFFVAKSSRDILKAAGAAKKLRISFFILGEGSNVLISDQGFNGLVIKILNTKYQILNTRLYAEAGVSFPAIVLAAGKKGLAGLEWAGGLPGTVGGAVRGNAGAFGGEVKDSLVSVECVDEKGGIRKLSNKECQFSYRSSIFKHKKWIVLSAVFQLKKGNKKLIEEAAQDHIRYRKERHPLEFPNAGSIFKNCDLKLIPLKLQDFVKPAVKVDPFPVVPTAFLVHQAGLKGLRQGGAQVSEKHPNYMVNLGGARAKDVRTLIEKVKRAIKKRFSVNLEEEIEFL